MPCPPLCAPQARFQSLPDYANPLPNPPVQHHRPSLASLAPDSQPNGVAWKPDGSEFATSDDAGNIQLWGSKRSYANAGALQPREYAGWTYPLAWKRDGTLLICGASSGLVQL
jgi:WD40 repeat protein